MDSILSSYQVEICWYTFDIELYGLRPYVMTVRLCMCLVFLTDWNLVMKEHQTRTQTDCNDIRPQTVQFHNERISTDLNLVTRQSTVNELLEEGLQNGAETCRSKLMWMLVLFKVYILRAWVGILTLRLLMSYIYGAHILDVSRSHTTTHHSR